MSVTVTGIVFRGNRQVGDFKWMVKQPEYADAVFIICENFIDMLFEEDNGSGTAVLRKNTWPNTQTPQAVGIPTGWSQVTGGFNPLDNTVKKVVRLAGLRILAHLRENPHVKRIIYSADEEDESLIGCNIFKKTIDPAVIKHISAFIHELPELYKVTTHQSTQSIRRKEYEHFQLAQALHDRDCARRRCNHAERQRDEAEHQLKEMKAKKRVATETPRLPPQNRPAAVSQTKAAVAKQGAKKRKIDDFMRS
jgi:hypothetical protein